MIYCVWYPSGGFGHFVNAVLSLHGENFVRPANSLKFSTSGDSHSLELIAPKYFHDNKYNFMFDDNFNYSVLVDNGINNEGTKFLETFPDAKIIKMCYDDRTWPVVAKTMIDKAMKSSIESELPIDDWGSKDDWAKREKYFLFLRDHELRYNWRGNDTATNIDIEKLLNYKDFKSAVASSGIVLSSFRKEWRDWQEHNFIYFLPVLAAQDIIKQVKKNNSTDLTMITDVWAQAVVYYYIWLEFGIEVPHNDYANFFNNTQEIKELICTQKI
jgi:hypothetical protein